MSCDELRKHNSLEFHGYVHALSPKKTKGNTTYFDMKLQDASGLHRAVCFSETHYAILQAAEKKQEVLKISQYRVKPNRFHPTTQEIQMGDKCFIEK